MEIFTISIIFAFYIHRHFQFFYNVGKILESGGIHSLLLLDIRKLSDVTAILVVHCIEVMHVP